MSQELRVKNLVKRAELLQASRLFFLERGILEVDTPLLVQKTPIDAHIDLIKVKASVLGKEREAFLTSSPEYGMKRLLAEGIGDIYQLGHVFRDNELSEKHNLEFTLCEWYRIGYTLDQMIDETLSYIRLFLDEKKEGRFTYEEALKKYTGLDLKTLTKETLLCYMEKRPFFDREALKNEEVDELLNYILGVEIEPHLGIGELTVLMDFPASQAALSQVIDGVSKRFEVYYKGKELANGYLELLDAEEQRTRFKEQNGKRKRLGKCCYPEDTFLIEALERGIPACSGVAVGFDRLLMLHLNEEHIKEVVPFTFLEV
jgi:lysyl-tRNA synthetase class 2